MEDRTIPRLNVISRDDQPQTGQHYGSIKDREDYTCFGILKGESRAITFKVIAADGKINVIHYSRVMSPIMYDGNNSIRLGTSNLILEIRGKNMEILLDYIAEQKLLWMKEPNESFLEFKEGEPEITVLKLSNRKNSGNIDNEFG